MPSLEFIEINTVAEPDSSVIWLHGLGADGSDFETLVDQLQLPKELGIRFIFPHAPIRPVTINGGYPMRAWFDILSLEEKAIQDAAGIRKSVQEIHELIAAVAARGISTDRIILGGFSQGGALALYLALHYPRKLAGAAALSAFMPLAEELSCERTQGLFTPIFLGHGTLDTVVPYFHGQRSHQLLKDLGYPVTWRSYPITHTISLDEIKDLSDWLQSKLLCYKPVNDAR